MRTLVGGVILSMLLTHVADHRMAPILKQLETRDEGSRTFCQPAGDELSRPNRRPARWIAFRALVRASPNAR